MRITDLALTTPLTGPRTAPSRRGPAEPGRSLASAHIERGEHPDEVAAAKLARAAGLAQATRVVLAQNEAAAHSVAGDRLDDAALPGRG